MTPRPSRSSCLPPTPTSTCKIAELAAFVGAPTALKGVTDKTLIKPVGAGPFVLESRDQGVKTVLKKNTGYWDAPRPYIDTYTLMVIPESNTGQNMIVQGGLDFMMGYAYQYGANATMPGVATKKVPINGYNIAYFITDGGTTGLFNDVKARQAVAAGVDRNKWVEALTQDATIKAPDALYPKTSPYFDAALVYPKYRPRGGPEAGRRSHRQRQEVRVHHPRAELLRHRPRRRSTCSSR